MTNFTYPFILRITAILMLSMNSIFVHALPSDNDLPMNITSDKLEFNNKTGVTVFTGNVTMIQGTTQLKADKVMVYKQTGGEIEKIIAIGKRAHYSTLPEEGKAVMDAFGNTIEYYPKKSQAVILGDGTIQQAGNTFSAQHITYDLAKETLISTPTRSGEKATLLLQPGGLNQ